MENILEMKQIYKAFPGVVANDHVDLRLSKGEVLALVGENGAGKSTLIKMLSGMYHPDSGEIILDGKSITSFTPRQALDAGVAVIYQELNYLNEMTIAENILVGQTPTKKVGVMKIVDYSNQNKNVIDIMKLVGLGKRKPTDYVRDLSVAEKQLIEIARAFTRNVKVLVLDEPTSALNETETEDLFKLIRRFKERGVGIIYISHRMEEIFHIADRVEVMRDGKYIWDKPIAETNEQDIVAAMVGRKIENMYPTRESHIGAEVFKVSNLNTKFLKNIGFNVHAGEVVGIFGLMGSGRTEVCRCLYGLQKPESIEMYLNGKQITNTSPLDALNHSMAYVPAERKTEGVNLAMDVKENITLSNIKAFVNPNHLLNLGKEKQIAQKWVDELTIKTPSLKTLSSSLSGGNQQKLVIAKSLNIDPAFMILNEPTRGIDVGAKVEIYKLINSLCDQGRAVLMISSELPEIMAMCDRIYVMCEGRITGEVQKQDFSQTHLMELGIGGEQ